MTDDTPPPESAETEGRREPNDSPASEGAASPSRPKPPGFVRRHWLPVLVAAVVLTPALVFSLWAWVALTYSYSEGERAGWVQKFSKKGWLCKTWEGELAMVNIPGNAPEIFRFSVRDPAVASEIVRHMGERVTLRYEQHVGVPTECFGETEYFVTSVHRVPTG